MTSTWSQSALGTASAAAARLAKSADSRLGEIWMPIDAESSQRAAAGLGLRGSSSGARRPGPIAEWRTMTRKSLRIGTPCATRVGGRAPPCRLGEFGVAEARSAAAQQGHEHGVGAVAVRPQL